MFSTLFRGVAFRGLKRAEDVVVHSDLIPASFQSVPLEIKLNHLG